ncbi:similar to Saccharomyces cerevisiae YMR104C YPK2 Protein kinase with similarity to serine/threonine protein kinase Ypk1p [Maudiozyma barnettii]|uniref:non-specific serine/threonine protein kinase n=1 Tax=Maudiozyma barnettii TaxID=61262 RepID=A0A8H2ZKM8_9SACH|nr:uncharacterized protein KABA2_13S03696 [Kazachstania barnettii]CAB4257133.1 similar to Saccharomyces cerevisiae YMR104C YPK2 Protein kinase with similarity to serine/threonine protein kinase Ypk1p [Kazachstania barnettii]CAD1779503.1 similar to Saccharomyces cerevisiae YMR104C YPK2 Protein kinase with similarity to serine/threonine protein kinase Ypk1p [Kazachstania barnettii]
MYSWKNKFKFGKSKEEKEVKHTSGFFHHNDAKQEEASSHKNSDMSRKETITDDSPSVIAPMRSSRDASSTATSTTNLSDELSQFSNSGPEINENVDQHQDIAGSQPIPNTSTSSSGVMTIKVYNGDGFVLPFPITANNQILSKLLNSGVAHAEQHSSQPHAVNVDQLISQLSRVTINNQGPGDESLIPDEISSKFIPATILLPGSNKLNPLLYFTIEFDNTVATIEPEYGTMEQPIFNKISTFDVTRKLTFLKVDVFARIPSILLPSKTWQQKMSASDEKLKGMLEKINWNEDIHLDTFHLPINLQIDSAANIRLYNHHWVTLDNGFGKINLSVDYKPSKNKPITIDDFDLLKVIGKGSFGKVMQVRKKDTQKIYALKAIRKSYIVSKSEVTHTLAERTVLARVDCPFIVPLKFSFQSPEKLYFVLAFINGGELFYHLQKEGRFDLSRSRFYTAELLCALETLHDLDVIYRDLKPENILLDYQGHIALCDFGLCKLNMKDEDKTDTFCGTPEYLAPELLLGQGYSKVVDWWTLGVLLYEMLTGLPPYYDEDVPKMYKKILQEPLRFPDGFDRDAKDLLIGLLSRDPTRRLGRNGADEIKNHPFFSQLSWKRLWMKGYIPPYKPHVSNAADTSNFDQEFTKEKPVDSVVDEFLSESVQKQFGGWTYVGNEQLGSSMVQGRSIR